MYILIEDQIYYVFDPLLYFKRAYRICIFQAGQVMNETLLTVLCTRVLSMYMVILHET